MEYIRTLLHLENGRPFVDLTVGGPEGVVSARFLVDTGGGGVLLPEAMARRCGIRLGGGRQVEEWGIRLEEIALPRLLLGGEELDAEGPAFAVLEGEGLPHGPMIAGRTLRRHRVVFDFPAGQFALAGPDVAPCGMPLPTPVHPETVFARVALQVEGETIGMLLDTGAGCTMISPRLLARWREEHPDWSTAEGAQGAARTGRPDLDDGAIMIRVPRAALGPFGLQDVWMVARPRGGNFEEFSKRALAGPALGALGCNALAPFRVEIDYRAGVMFLARNGVPPSAFRCD